VGVLLALLAPLQYYFAHDLWRGQPLRAGAEAPRATVYTEAGREWTPAADSGRVVVLSFWATWCEPCRRELPLLDSLRALLDSTEAVRIYAVNVGEPKSKVDDFVRTSGLRLPVLYDTAEVAARLYSVTALPTLVVIGRSGRVILAEAGFQPTMPYLLMSAIEGEVEEAFRRPDSAPRELPPGAAGSESP